MGFGSPIARLDVFDPDTSGERPSRWTVMIEHRCGFAGPDIYRFGPGFERTKRMRLVDCTIMARRVREPGQLRSNLERIGGDLEAYVPELGVALMRSEV